MKGYLKWLLVLLVVLMAVFIFVITLGRGDTFKNREIAGDLLKFHGLMNHAVFNETDFIKDQSLRQSLTNLPFHGRIIESQGGATHYKVSIRRDYDLRIIQFHQYYWLENSTANPSEWTLYHVWDWGSHRTWSNHRLVAHKLLTIVETNTPSH